MIPVIWLDHHIWCWDQVLVDHVLRGNTWAGMHPTTTDVDHEASGAMAHAYRNGAVVVVPARYHTAADVNRLIAPLDWAVVILTSDEESTFPWREVTHPNMRRWIMTPRPELHAGHVRFLGEGWPTDTPTILAGYTAEHLARPLDWFFAGQVNHPRRKACVRALASMTGGRLVQTEGFTQGLTRDLYLRAMASAKVIPCPSGPATPDSFRAYEALEAGCVPIVDGSCPAGVDGYWPFTFGLVPFPVIDDWASLPTVMAETLADWPAITNRCSAWWQRYKRDLAVRISDDITAVSGLRPPIDTVDQAVTVLIPTSPIPAHPDTSVIEATIDSVRDHLPSAEIIVMCDGVRPEQASRTADYEEYQRRLLWLCDHRWTHVTPVRSEAHQHQANLTRAALEFVRTPCVLFVEHDTPLVTDEPIDWQSIIAAVRSGEVNMIRLHHEAVILEPHRPLMIDQTPIRIAGCPLLRTVQWSQRPHVASTDYYRRVIDEHFPTTSRTMIEDKLHSVCQVEPWSSNRVAIYAPGTNLKRSLHLDGRGADPKFEMAFG